MGVEGAERKGEDEDHRAEYFSIFMSNFVSYLFNKLEGWLGSFVSINFRYFFVIEFLRIKNQ